jgi:hypothetical protein
MKTVVDVKDDDQNTTMPNSHTLPDRHKIITSMDLEPSPA